MGGVSMPQLSLYIDADILAKIETAAKINNVSVSKWVSDRLKESLSNKWPDNYHSLFGSVKDDTFNIDKIKDYHQDLKREEL